MSEFLRTTFRVIGIAVSQALPENIELCLARTIREQWVSNLEVSSFDVFGL